MMILERNCHFKYFIIFIVKFLVNRFNGKFEYNPIIWIITSKITSKYFKFLFWNLKSLSLISAGMSHMTAVGLSKAHQIKSTKFLSKVLLNKV